MITIECAHHRTYNRKRSDTIKQKSGGQSLCKIRLGKMSDKPVEASFKIKNCSNQSAYGQTGNEQNRIITFRHVCGNGINAKSRSSKSHGREKSVLVFFLDATFQYASQRTADEYGYRVDDGSNHSFSYLIFSRILVR